VQSKLADDELPNEDEFPDDLLIPEESVFGESDLDDVHPEDDNSPSTQLRADDVPEEAEIRRPEASKPAPATTETAPLEIPADPAGSYLGLLSSEERAAIAERAFRRGPGIADPDWIIAYAMQRAVDQLGAELNSAVTRMRGIVAEPREYIVHADGASGRPDDVVAIRGQLDAILDRLEALPYRSSSSVARMTEPFTQLAEASAKLVSAIDKSRTSATESIAESAKAANRQMLRTAFEGHALPAKRATFYHAIEIGLLVVLIVAVVAAGFHAEIARTR
jgi:hypothetical protein